MEISKEKESKTDRVSPQEIQVDATFSHEEMRKIKNAAAEARSNEPQTPEELNARIETIYRMEGIRDVLEEKSREIYATGENFEKFLTGLGLDQDQLNEKEKQELELFAQYAGKRLLNAALNQEGVKYESTEDVLETLEKHAEKLSPFARHDLVHAMIAYNINSGHNASLDRKNSPVPEFLRPASEISGSQAVIEELPAILWTEIEHKPTISVFMEGKAVSLLDFFKKDNTKDIADREVVEKMEKELSNPRETDFESFIRKYADFAFYLVKVFNKLQESGNSEKDGLTGDQLREKLKEWESKFDPIWNKAKNLFNEELERFMHDESQGQGSETKRRTLRLLLEKSKAIFDNYDKNPRIIFDEFKSMGASFFENSQKKKN